VMAGMYAPVKPENGQTGCEASSSCGEIEQPTSYKLYQVDAFSAVPFAGNPAGICVLPKGDWPEDDVMKNIARENNLSETAFLLPPPDSQTDCDYLIRWFTGGAVSVEVSLCGHATLAAALVVERFLNHVKDKPIRFVSPISGPLPVEPRETPKGASGNWYTMRFPVDVLVKQDAPPPALLESLNLPPGTNLDYYRGKTDGILIMNSPQDVLDSKPDLKKLSVALADRRALIITAKVPQGTTHVGPHQLTGVDNVLRFFGPMSNIEEDPVTGSAFCSLAPLWSGLLNVHDRPLVTRQISVRSGYILSQVNGSLVDISGASALFLEGTIHVPSS